MNEAILSDAVESLIGAIYVDSGYSESLKFITNIWYPYLDIEASNEQEPKSHLQELFQEKYKILPEYILIKSVGPSHSPTFSVSLDIKGLKSIIASGNSIKEAEKNVAIQALKILK